MSDVAAARMREFSQAVQELWRLSLGCAPDEFQAQAIEIARRVVPFDASFWGIASTGQKDLIPHAVHLDGLSAEAILEYESIRDVDVLAQWMVQNPGRTRHFDVRAETGRAPQAVIDFDVRFGIEQVLCTMVVEPVPRLASFLSLYRSPGKETFSEEERVLVEALAPHLAGAFEACRTRGTGKSAEARAPERIASVDTQGTLHTQDDALVGLLREEWAGWSGRDLPEPLREPCRRGGTFVGKAIVARIEAPRGAFTRIAVRRKAPADRLSPQEREIAQAFALGVEAAEIATTMGLSVASVRNRLRQLYAKLGVASRVELVEAIAVLGPPGA